MIRVLWRVALAMVLGLTLQSALAAQEPAPSKQILKTPLGTCYEVDPDFLPAITHTVQTLRSQIRMQAGDKLVAYLSVPLTARGGGYRPLNVEVSEFLKSRMESRFQGRVWVLAPGKVESELPQVNGKSPQGGEYMYMWTSVLAGDDGYGRDFNFLFAAGPSDIRAFFGAPEDTFASLERYIDLRAKADTDFRDNVALKAEAKKRFLAYYATKASVAFSDGSHDEWNIFVEINRRRRSNQKTFGLGDQIPVFFDGRGVSPGEMEQKVSPGYEKTCPEK
jgi:hypothetical protein